MSNGTDAMVETLKNSGVELLPYDEEMSIPNFPHGSIQWEDFYKHHRIEEKTGYSAKMYADVEDDKVCINSITRSKSVTFDPADPEAFASAVKQVMINFYLEL